MDFIADYILIACFCHPDEVNHTIVKSDQNFLGGLIVGDADGLLGVSFGPHLNKFGGLEITLPGLDAANFHKLTSLILPWKFSIGNLSIDFIDRTCISGGNKDDIFFFNKEVVSDSFRLTLNSIINVQFRRIHHNF